MELGYRYQRQVLLVVKFVDREDEYESRRTDPLISSLHSNDLVDQCRLGDVLCLRIDLVLPWSL